MRDPQELEEFCESMRKEIALLKRSVSVQEAENNKLPFEDLARQRREAAARARNAYSHDQRVRDLQDMARILERQANALSAELRAIR